MPFISPTGFTSHFTTISANNSITTGWLTIAPMISQLEFYEFQVAMFSEKNTFLLLLIFSVKALDNAEFIFDFHIHGYFYKLLTQNKLIRCTFVAFEILNFLCS